MMQARQSQWELADRGFRRVVQLAPRDVLWRQHYAIFVLLPLGRVEESIRQLRAAEEIDPLPVKPTCAIEGPTCGWAV